MRVYRNRKIMVVALLSCVVLLLSAFGGKDSIAFIIPKGWPKPLYNFAGNPLTDDGFKLGRKLFYDPVLSRDSSISCMSCHLQFTGFTHVDHSLSHGINGLKGTRNSMSLFNLAWGKFFMWDGGVNNLEVQPLNPITNPVEMDNSMENIVKKLNASPKYRKMFYHAFGDSVVTGQHVLKALAQFLVMLESYNSKYDKVMRGERGYSFTPVEKRGLVMFRQHCNNCHTEPLFTDGSFRNNGLPLDKELNDLGRMKVTNDRNDSLKFKVPSLRNVVLSYPYMHDGRFHSLNDVLEHYRHGIQHNHTLDHSLRDNININDDDKQAVIQFLHTLTDSTFMFDSRFRDYQN